MKLIPILMFAISANIDNFVVGVAYGIKKVKIDFWCNVIIAGVTFIGTFLSMALGKFLFSFIDQRVANILGSTILILLGLVYTIKSLKGEESNKKLKMEMKKDETHSLKFYEELIENPEEVLTECIVYINPKEALYIGVALTLNNIAIGVTVSILGINIIFTAIMSFVFSMLAIFVGYILGKTYLSGIFGKYGSLISGLIIIFMGIYELFF